MSVEVGSVAANSISQMPVPVPTSAIFALGGSEAAIRGWRRYDSVSVRIECCSLSLDVVSNRMI